MPWVLVVGAGALLIAPFRVYRRHYVLSSFVGSAILEYLRSCSPTTVALALSDIGPIADGPEDEVRSAARAMELMYIVYMTLFNSRRGWGAAFIITKELLAADLAISIGVGIVGSATGQADPPFSTSRCR